MKEFYMRKFLVLMLAALLLTGCGGKKTVPPPRLTKVAALTLTPSPAVNIQEYPGLLTPLYKMNVQTNTGGIVEAVLVELGQTVRKGQALAKMESEVNAAQYNQAKAAYDLAKSSFDRQKALYEAEVISQQAFETARSQFQQAEAQYNVAKKNLEDCTLTAPRDGVVSFINYDVGDNASHGSTVIVVADYSKIILRIGVVDRDIAKVRIGQNAAVHIDEIDRLYTGKIIGAGSLADDKTGAYPVRIEIDNSAGFIKPGMFGRARLTLEYYPQAKVVPLDTLVLRGESKGLYEITSGNIARLTPVTVNFEFEDKAYVQSPLAFGSRIVAKGQEFIVDGEEVEIVPEN
ncbi:type I secretion membrane fusion protein HlyD super family [Candidatus Termititenax aidoneus]|uniref:Type I secretion membrane fusion protein HlyD super family n=1 Tax=Termititenax aidoneus TaxID=2218524 RepID=A0A388TAM7_TERA1|nr:type I secretion membrane fusion protein HlyD super family [Candidatus Termititenax aidoneus]